MTRRLLLLPVGLFLLAACSGGAQEASTSSAAPSSSAASSSVAPSPSPEPSESGSKEPETILAVLCDSATDKQIAVLEAAMKPGYSVKQIVDVRTREGGEHAILGIVEGPDVSGPARWIGSKERLDNLQSADQAATTSSTAPLMTAPSQDAIDYLNQTQTCFDAIYE